jgi:hypothetical protein
VTPFLGLIARLGNESDLGVNFGENFGRMRFRGILVPAPEQLRFKALAALAGRYLDTTNRGPYQSSHPSKLPKPDHLTY